MASDHEDLVQPTPVRLYHRNDTWQNQPVKWKTPTDTDFTLKAILVTVTRTNGNRHEIQVWHGPKMDPRSPGSPRNRSQIDHGSGSDLVATFDLKTIKSCVIKSKVWIEITESSGFRNALEFTEDDPNFLAFYEKLMTLVKLLGVKCKLKDSIKRTKWLESVCPSGRALPPLPVKPPLPADPESVKEEYQYSRCILRDSEEQWPTMPPPPFPSASPSPCQVQPGVDRRDSDRTFVHKGSIISNSSNSIISNNGDILNSNIAPESYLYLLPCDTGAQYVNGVQVERPTTGARNNPSPPPPPPPPSRKSKPGPQKQVVCSSIHVASCSCWSCSACTLRNPSTNTRCTLCDKQRNADTNQHKESTKKYNDRREDESSCQECMSVFGSKAKSLNCKECERLGQVVPSGCKECRNNTADTKTMFLICEKCLQIIHIAPTECKECRHAKGFNSKSLKYDECTRCASTKTEESKGNRFPKYTAKSTISTISTPLRSSPTTSKVKYEHNTTPPFATTAPTSGSEATVFSWRCQRCTLLNVANVFFCETCNTTRDDAWQCQVCDTVISLDVWRCQRCDVWRCRLCTNQNDARQNRSKFCHACSQPQ